MTASVLVLTLNEEINIEECLKTLSWCDDIVVLDSHSSDRTVEIAKLNGARIVQRPFDNWASHQNWAMANIDFKNPWVLYLDADERCDEELRAEVAANAQPDSAFSAFRIRRKDFYLGRWLKHAQLYPTWLVRLFRPERIRYERLVNPVATVDGQIGQMRGHILHYPFSHGVGHWIARHNRYSDFEAAETLKEQSARSADVFCFLRRPKRASSRSERAVLSSSGTSAGQVHLLLLRASRIPRRPGRVSLRRTAGVLRIHDQLQARRVATADSTLMGTKPPRVIFVNRYFHPDQSATSQMLSDLAFGLAKQGFEIVVVPSRQTYENPRASLPCTRSSRGRARSSGSARRASADLETSAECSTT